MTTEFKDDATIYTKSECDSIKKLAPLCVTIWRQCLIITIAKQLKLQVPNCHPFTNVKAYTIRSHLCLST